MKQAKGILIGIIFSSIFWFSCQDSSWKPVNTILLDGISPIGITTIDDIIWLSDGDHNRLVSIDDSGHVTSEISDVERPMHVSSQEGKLYVPSYGTDQILTFKGGEIDTLSIAEELEAPGAVDISGGRIAIADFYNHRIVYYNGTAWTVIGSKGKADGELHYPTDVQFAHDKIYVADAYNNRGQVFDLEGNHLMTFGQDEGFNAATGIFVDEDQIFLTDFENDRVVIFDLLGQVNQIIDTGLNKPTDVAMINQQIWIINYIGKYISTYSRG